MHSTALCLALLAACAPAGARVVQPAASVIALPPRQEMAKHHMRLHFGDLEYVEHLLLDGKLADAKEFAFLLTMPETDPRFEAWAPQLDAVADAARKLQHAPSVAEALRSAVRVAGACAHCHLDANRPVALDPPPIPPSEIAVAAVRMQRHQWATSRLWEGLVVPDDARWTMGLEVLAAAPLSFTPGSASAALATTLQERAASELARGPLGTVEERVTAYGEILVTCAACHATLLRRAR